MKARHPTISGLFVSTIVIVSALTLLAGRPPAVALGPPAPHNLQPAMSPQPKISPPNVTLTPSPPSVQSDASAQGADIVLEGNGHVHWEITDRNSGAIYITDVGLWTPEFEDMVQDVNDVYGYHGGEVVGMDGDLGPFWAGQRLLFFLHTGADEGHRDWFFSDGSNCTVTKLGTDHWKLAWEDGGGGDVSDLTVDISLHSTGSIHGKVRWGAIGIPDINLLLQRYDGSSWSGMTTTMTQPGQGYPPFGGGSYSFAGVPSLGAGQKYRVVYRNGEDGNPDDSDSLRAWYSFEIPSYTAGASVEGGDFELCDVGPYSPAYWATVQLPSTFGWGTSRWEDETYELHLFGSFHHPYRSFNAGTQYEYTLTSLPSGFFHYLPYEWEVWIYASNGGLAISYPTQLVMFSSGASVHLPLAVRHLFSPPPSERRHDHHPSRFLPDGMRQWQPGQELRG